MERGVIAGHKVQDVAVEVHFGKHHEVDSSEAAFKIAGSMAFRNVFQQAKPALLGADREDGNHRARSERRRRLQRHVRPRRPRAGQRLGRRRLSNRLRRSAAAAK